MHENGPLEILPRSKAYKKMHSMNVTMASVTAMALTAELGNIERIDRLASVAEIRRNAILREIDFHRAPLARALRDILRDIEDTKFETIEPKRVTAKIKINKDAASGGAAQVKLKQIAPMQRLVPAQKLAGKIIGGAKCASPWIKPIGICRSCPLYRGRNTSARHCRESGQQRIDRSRPPHCRGTD